MSDAPAGRLARVREEVDRAAWAAGRDPASVRLVAVGKTFPPAALEALYRAGQRDFGENRVQEAAAAVRTFRWVHSVESLSLAHRLERLAADAGRTIEALVQVDLAGEASKFGVAPAELDPLLAAARAFRFVKVRGLMLLPPYDPDPEKTRPHFRRLREIAAALESRGLLGFSGPVDLSMGMSHDFAVAVQEGATLIRLGTALFGGRPAGGPAAPAGEGAQAE